MGSFVAGEVVVVNFPFSGFAGFKRRPALVLGHSGNSDVILCQITSRNYQNDSTVVAVSDVDTCFGELSRKPSFIRPDKIFTIESEEIEKIVCRVSVECFENVKFKLRRIFEL